MREAKEELGINDFIHEKVGCYVFESTKERELVYSFMTIYDGKILTTEELDGGRFWSKEEILNNLGKNVFTPNFESEYFEYLRK